MPSNLSRVFVATARVTGTTDIPAEPCTLCGAEVGDNGLWVIMPKQGIEIDDDTLDVILHLVCADFIAANAKVLRQALADDE